jgi:hypothetical protein
MTPETPEQRIKDANYKIRGLEMDQETWNGQIKNTEEKIRAVNQNKDLDDKTKKGLVDNYTSAKSTLESEYNKAADEIKVQEGKKKVAQEAIKERDQTFSKKDLEKKAKAEEEYEHKQTHRLADNIHEQNKEFAEHIDKDHHENTPNGPDGSHQPHGQDGQSHGPGPELPTGGHPGAGNPTSTSVQVDGSAHAGVHTPDLHGSWIGAEVAVAVGTAYATKKIMDVGPKMVDKAQEMYQQAGQKLGEAADSFNKKWAPQDAELHDLSKEQAAAEKLTNSEKFSDKPFEKKAAEVNGFFKQQDQLRDAAWENLQQKTDTMLAEYHKNDRSPQAYLQDRNQLESDVQATRQAEHQEVQKWRSEMVQGMCKDEATKQVNFDNKQAKDHFEKNRLNDLNKSSRAESEMRFDANQKAKTPQNIEMKTEKLKENHFPELKSPTLQSPSVAPSVPSQSLANVGAGSGPGGR